MKWCYSLWTFSACCTPEVPKAHDANYAAALAASRSQHSPWVKHALLSLLLLSHLTLAADCFDMAGKDAAIDPDLLRAIAWQESGLHFRVVGKNPVSGYGMGLMQIDSQHLVAMNNRGIDRELLLSDICTNIYSGTLILAQAFNRWGATWEAVGAYNAGFAITKRQHYRRMLYARKIHATYWKIKHSKGKGKSYSQSYSDANRKMNKNSKIHNKKKSENTKITSNNNSKSKKPNHKNRQQ